MLSLYISALLYVVSVGSVYVELHTKETATPINKVLDMMKEMLDKAKEEKHNEQIQFSSFKQFCDSTTSERSRSIKAEKGNTDKFAADIEGYAAKARKATKRIAKLDEDIAVWGRDIKAATKVRQIEKEDYQTTHKDYEESIDALERAIQTLKKQAFDRPQATFMQLKTLTKADVLPSEATKMIDSFLSDTESQEQEGHAEAPEAEGYDFASSGVVEMLEKLQDKFQAELRKMEREEMLKQQAFEMLTQDLNTHIAQAEKDRGESADRKAKRLQMKAAAEGDLDDSSETKGQDEKYVKDLLATCGQKTADFAQRQKLRTEEIDAITKALEIISSAAVKGSGAKYLPALLQTKRTALAQINVDGAATLKAKDRLSTFLNVRAKQLRSAVLSSVAHRARADPLVKVKKMIKDLIVKLMEEANEEAEHHSWCTKELATNKNTRTEKTDSIETLQSEIDQLDASVSKLTEDLAQLSNTITELDDAIAEATDLRKKEHDKNAATIEDAKEAQTAVAQAITVLKEFYEKAGEATALVQEQPEVFDEAYKGLTAMKGGVMGMLEVIQSDFARLEADTTASEASALKEYKSFMEDSKEDKAAKMASSDHKTAKKQDDTQTLTIKKEDLQGTQKELDAAMEYYDKLKPSCVDTGPSYEDRVARRKEEIESLQDALRILNGEDMA